VEIGKGMLSVAGEWAWEMGGQSSFEGWVGSEIQFLGWVG